jgi:DNA replicative helicase MCM subunit Mcm2 (Cdc46/Mcm family)/Mn-dependent DtxR family transcriptional regulator
MSIFEEISTRLSVKDIAEGDGEYFYCGIHGDEESPDLKVYEDGNWKCFSCEAKGGDVVSYVAQRDDLEQIEAAKKLVDKYQLDIETGEAGEDKQKRKKRQRIGNVQEDVVSKAQENLPDEVAQKLQENRGWTQETVEELRIGWLDSELFQQLKERYEELLSEAGFHYRMSGADETEGMALIPHLERNGRPYLVTAMMLREDREKAEEIKKYEQMKSKGNDFVENDIYKVLNNQSDLLILTEGYPDAISTYQEDFDVIAAGCGSFQGNYRELIKKAEPYEKTVIITDRDETGRENLENTARKLSGQSKVYVWNWKSYDGDAEDLDELLDEKQIDEIIDECSHFLDKFKSYAPGEISATNVGHRISVSGRALASKGKMAIPRKIQVKCRHCYNDKERDFLEGRGKMIEQLLLSQKHQDNLISKYISNHIREEECPQEDVDSHDWYWEVTETLNKSFLKIQELARDMTRFEANEVPTLPVYLIGDELPNSRKLTLRGEIKIDKRSDELVLIADSAERMDDDFENFESSDELMEKFDEKWEKEKAEMMIADDMVGRPLSRTALQLTLHSPIEIPGLYRDDKTQRGSLRTLFYGDGGTYKSDQSKEVVRDFELGAFVNAETSSRTGIIYSINTEQNVIEWGKLPLYDRTFVAIDGMQALDADQMGQMREVLDKQVVEVDRYVSGVAPARVRLVGMMNPPKDRLQDYGSNAEALEDIPIFKAPDIRRWDLYIPFDETDVTNRKLSRAKPRGKPYDENFYKKHIYWAWNLKPGDITYTDEFREEFQDRIEGIMDAFKFAGLPIVSGAFRDKFLRLCVSWAILQHDVNEDGIVVVKRKHAGEMTDFWSEMVDQLDLKAAVEEYRDKKELTDSEKDSLVKQLSADQLRIFQAVQNGKTTSGEIGEEVDLSSRSVKEKWSKLKSSSLVKVRPGEGAIVQPKGNQFQRQVRIDRLIEAKQSLDGDKLEELHEVHEFTEESEEGVSDSESDSGSQPTGSKDSREKVKKVKSEEDISERKLEAVLKKEDGEISVGRLSDFYGFDKNELYDFVRGNEKFEESFGDPDGSGDVTNIIMLNQ